MSLYRASTSGVNNRWRGHLKSYLRIIVDQPSPTKKNRDLDTWFCEKKGSRFSFFERDHRYFFYNRGSNINFFKKIRSEDSMDKCMTNRTASLTDVNINCICTYFFNVFLDRNNANSILILLSVLIFTRTSIIVNRRVEGAVPRNVWLHIGQFKSKLFNISVVA